jgi:hypothetical protein
VRTEGRLIGGSVGLGKRGQARISDFETAAAQG